MPTSPHLTRYQVIRLGRILDMMYRPAEIAAEIGVSIETIYRAWLPAGMPHQRDPDQTIWIHGPALVAWAQETNSQQKNKRPMPDGHGWCMKCNRVVKMLTPVRIYQNRYIEIVQAACLHCQTPVNRAQKRSAS